MRLLFSQRYRRAIDQTALVVEIPDTARRKIWAWLSANNTSLGIQRDPNDRWISESDLLIEHGWERLPVTPYPADTQYHAALRLLMPDDRGLVRLRHHRDRVGLHGACRKGRAAPEGQSDVRT